MACNGVSCPTQLCARDRGGTPHLVDVDRVVRTTHRDVDGLAELRGQSFADRPGLLGDVQPAGDRTGQPQDAEAEPVLAAVLGLLDQFAVLECAEQPEGGRLVHADVGGHFADAGLTALGEDLQHADGAVDRLHSAARHFELLLMTQLYEPVALVAYSRNAMHIALSSL